MEDIAVADPVLGGFRPWNSCSFTVSRLKDRRTHGDASGCRRGAPEPLVSHLGKVMKITCLEALCSVFWPAELYLWCHLMAGLRWLWRWIKDMLVFSICCWTCRKRSRGIRSPWQAAGCSKHGSQGMGKANLDTPKLIEEST